MLKKYNQEHLLRYESELTSEEKQQLHTQIESIDFELIHEIYKNKGNHEHHKESDIQPIKGVKLSEDQKESYWTIGLEAIKSNKVGVVLMAGGQGTRLGHTGPKGTYDIGLPSGKSLFELQCDKLSRLHSLTQTYIHWYIMTSDDNHQETVNHFNEHNYFEYPKKYIHFFKQDRLPLILEDGAIAMKSNYEINLAANGNGGVFSSLKSNGLFEHMSENDIEYVYLYGVDNAIAKVADPIFIGFAKETGLDIVNKAVEKKSPEEKVGVFCYRDGKPGIVEYSELNDEQRYQRDADGSLSLKYGNIVSHIFKLDFLKACANKALPYHTAHKKVAYYNGKLIQPTEPNGFKFELFLFDVFKYVNDMGVLSVNRADEFTPVKNKEGHDSPKEAVDAILKLHKKWIDEAKKDFPYGCEIDSKATYRGENLKEFDTFKLYK